MIELQLLQESALDPLQMLDHPWKTGTVAQRVPMYCNFQLKLTLGTNGLSRQIFQVFHTLQTNEVIRIADLHVENTKLQKRRCRKCLTIPNRKTWSKTGKIPSVSFLYISPILLQGLAQMRLCDLLRRLKRKLLFFPPTSLALDNGYPMAKGFEKGGNRIVKFAHYKLGSICGF